MSVRISVEGATVAVPTYVPRDASARTWASLLMGAAVAYPRRELRELLTDLNFELGAGDRLALLGMNGAGKSTLLRLLNGVYQPTRGRVCVEGSRQALLNISLGFHGEATVRENVYLRGTAMGMKATVIRELMDAILDFAGLERKAGDRLVTLSTGQRMRLGFAISSAIQHDIILMDEWVGAGDAEFMAKAKERMLSRVAGSKIVVFASHSLGLLKEVCNRGLVLDQGRLVFFGEMTDALKAYNGIVSRAQQEGRGAGERVQTVGCVEEIALENGRLTLRGWALQGFVAMPRILAMDVMGERKYITAFERLPRPDVQKHFGLSEPVCGFRCALELPGLSSLAQIDGQLEMFGGNGESELDGPFRIASGVLQRISPVSA